MLTLSGNTQYFIFSTRLYLFNCIYHHFFYINSCFFHETSKYSTNVKIYFHTSKPSFFYKMKLTSVVLNIFLYHKQKSFTVCFWTVHNVRCFKISLGVIGLKVITEIPLVRNFEMTTPVLGLSWCAFLNLCTTSVAQSLKLKWLKFNKFFP